jgi:regulator of RNase E activity RraA
VARLTFVAWQQPIGCGGVAVFPGDIVVADGDGAVVIPPAWLEEVVAAAREQERLEAWIQSEVENGAALPGLYPPNEDNRARYAASVRGTAGAGAANGNGGPGSGRRDEG